MRTHFLLLVTALTLLAASCATSKPATTDAAQPAHPDYRVVATIKDIMDSAVDPSADYIWESVGTEVSAKGTIARQPRTEDEWKEERRRAIILVEAANLLVMPGRHVAKAGEKSENPGIELGPEEIEDLINKDRATFIQSAWKLQETALEQLKMVDARDVEGLLRVGGDVDAACETCHRRYWYPNEPVSEPLPPPAPAETKPAGKGK